MRPATGKPEKRPLVGVLSFLAAVLVLANLLLLVTREPEGVLLPEHRENDAFRLAGLTARSHPRTEASGAVQITYTFADRCGSPLGLAIVSQISHDNTMVEPETQLWFTLSAPPNLPRSPGQPAISAVSLVRQDLLSDFVTGAEPDGLELELSDLGIPSNPGETSLTINNLEGPGARTASTTHRPSLRNMVWGSHCRLRAEDLEIFALLTRILRVRICDDLTVSPSPCYNSSLTLFRDLYPDTYRLDLRTLGEDHGLLHLSLEIHRDGAGMPEELVYRLLPHSSLRKTANLFFTHPRPRGELLQSSDPGFAGLRFTPPMSPEQLGEVSVDFRKLVASLPIARRAP